MVFFFFISYSCVGFYWIMVFYILGKSFLSYTLVNRTINGLFYFLQLLFLKQTFSMWLNIFLFSQSLLNPSIRFAYFLLKHLTFNFQHLPRELSSSSKVTSILAILFSESILHFDYKKITILLPVKHSVK